jgi:hypothetical protein
MLQIYNFYIKIYKNIMRDYEEEKRKIKEKWKNNIEYNQSIYPYKTSEIVDTKLPISQKVFSKTIGFDLLSVVPMSMPLSRSADNTKVINETRAVNRDKKIESIVEGTEYTPMKPEDHPDYKPGIRLFYFDIGYGV